MKRFRGILFCGPVPGSFVELILRARIGMWMGEIGSGWLQGRGYMMGGLGKYRYQASQVDDQCG